MGTNVARRTAGQSLPPCDTPEDPPGDSHFGEPGSQSSAARSPRGHKYRQWRQRQDAADAAAIARRDLLHISRADIARATPPGSRRVRTRKEALARGIAEADASGHREDFRDHLVAWWECHVNEVSWGGEGRPPRAISQPGRDRVCEKTGMSESTYKRCKRWWRSRGFCGVARPGSTRDVRAGVLAAEDDPGNVREAILLCVPRVKAPHHRPSPDPVENQPDAPPGGRALAVTGPLGGSRREQPMHHARTRDPRSKPGRQAGTQEPCKTGRRRGAPRPLALLRGDFGPVTSGWWAHLTDGMPATWTSDDIVYAIDHMPGGRPQPAGRVHHPAAALKYRLGFWRRPDGSWLPSPSQARAADAAARRQEQAERRAADARRAAATARDWDSAAAAARALLAASSAGAAGVIAQAEIARQRREQPQQRPRSAPVTWTRRPAAQLPADHIAPVVPIRRDPAIEAADAELQAAVARALASIAAQEADGTPATAEAAAQDGDS